MTQTPLGDYDLDPFGNSDPLPDLSGAPEEDDYELDPWGEGWENCLNTP